MILIESGGYLPHPLVRELQTTGWTEDEARKVNVHEFARWT
ncbi:MAG TPA: hypothetical protein VG294_07825 [Solirubrobacteraceae bacterium]|nr:hypothetical protein [Solirubrobacteraceae bacterium]